MDPGERRQLPIACTLGADDGAQRMAEWREIADRAGAGRSVTSGKVTLAFRDGHEVGADLQRLVDAERECCAFLGWQLNRTPDGWAVEVTGTDDELRTVSLTA